MINVKHMQRSKTLDTGSVLAVPYTEFATENFTAGYLDA